MSRFWWRIISLLLYFIIVHLRISFVQSQCTANQFQCSNGRCIPLLWKCDEDNDCQDFSDERSCPSRTCSETEFTCNNRKCIPSRWQCDKDNDCGDNSDETENCSNRTCAENQFPCTSSNICIPVTWRCDEQEDCLDGSDELNCAILTCTSDEFQCDNGKCVTMRWVCDQDNDCGDKSDEVNCPIPTCSFKEFKCANGRCIPEKWACDGDADCNDGSDEANCTSQTSASHCSNREFECANKRDCIHLSWRCDGDQDCADGSDEADCHTTCRPDQFTCKNNQCIPGSLQCDGNQDCIDNSDEVGCVHTPKPCDPKTQFDCGDGHCILIDSVCDKHNDCEDGRDEPANKCYIDECNINNGGCLQNCVDTKAGFYCTCNVGFVLVGNSSCEDIDECEILGSCSQICSNTKGGFKCSCTEGYQIDPKRPHFCKAIGHEASLLFTNRHDIREIQLNSFHLRPVVSDLRSAIALDYFYKEGIVIWSDVAQEKIFSASIYKSNSSYVEIIKENLNTPDGIAVDWIYSHIYWTDTGKNTIEVADLKGKFRKTLISTELDEPRAIVVDPRFGWMYWTDWGQQPKIERAGLDGTRRKAIVLKDIQWPNGLAIDYVLNRLYWIDAKLHTIASCDFEGSNRQIILSSSYYLRHPFSITVFEDTLFWTDWETESIHSTNKFHGDNVSDIALSLFSPMDIHVYHELKHPDSTNYCGLQNGGCSHLCLPAPQINERSAKYTCACADGWKILSNGLTCYNEVAISSNPSSTSSSNSTIDIILNLNYSFQEDQALSSNNTDGAFLSSTFTDSSPVSSSTNTTYTSNKNSSSKPREEAHIFPIFSSSNKGSSSQAFPAAVVTTMSPDITNGSQNSSQQHESDSGKVAGIVMGVIGLLVLLGGLIGFFIWRQYVRRHVKSMNFDNPVYRKTTEDQFSLEKNQYQPSRSYPSTLEPLTTQGTNDFV